ncbi:MAG: nucleotidyltransferase domain-containing protein [Deltaproteobacteria bacterium]|jgi:predicted nucleotidyltransferase|nr:nucleotidyltransferase domain-containing protein [Deltaproteobacteria bacterium]MBW2533355.1 nucleotidyltransferase domain-containing protein [Deltaproteobacteria bacterium]
MVSTAASGAEQVSGRLGFLAERPELELVVLFGSHAEGRARTESDVDLAVVADDGCMLEQLRLDIIQVLGTDRIDLIDLRRAPPLLQMAVAKRGTVIHARDPAAFARFASLAVRRYNDTRKLRVERARGLAEFLAERGLT